jgi:endonuclease YncB( thermonuclease family)
VLRFTRAFAIALVALLGTLSTLEAQSAQPVNCAVFDSWEWAQSAYAREHGTDAAATVPGGVCPLLPHGAAPALWTDAIPQAVQPARVVEIVDGDTVAVQRLGGSTPGAVENLRLILIDTPETKDPFRPVGCFGTEAAAFTAWLLGQADNGVVYLETDVSDRDRFGRLLRYVWLEIDGKSYLVNEALARSGYGLLSTYPPDVKYAALITEAQRFAQAHGLGLWEVCDASGSGSRTLDLTAAGGPNASLSAG